MNQTVVVLAVTRMLSGFCLAGVDPSGRWVRPVRAHAVLTLADVSYRDGTLMAPFDRAELALEAARPDPPHVEDVLWDPVRRPAKLVGRLDPAERAAFLAAHVEPDAAPLRTGRRSLLLVRAPDLLARFALDGYSGKFEARVALPGDSDGPGVACTDLRWRAFGRSLLPPHGGQLTLTAGDLARRFGCEDAYLALGLGRQLDGRYTPLVVGVHLVPDVDVVVDPRRP